jgi:23S rRNA pseudouridine1911/1915/1917 synthase
VKADDELSLETSERHSQDMLVPKQSDLEIVYEDDSILVLNKPVGVSVHPGAAHYDDTLANAIKYYLQQKGEDLFGDDRAGLVHRLDKPTSGVLIVAKTPQSLWYLSRQFAERRVKKSYLAVVQGLAKPDFRVENKIGRDKFNRQKFSSRTNSGRQSLTDFHTIAVSEDKKFSLVEARPHTGRTHQIRVHLAELGLPILGDVSYGGERSERLMLHSYRLELSLLEGGKKVLFTAPPDKVFLEVLHTLGLRLN